MIGLGDIFRAILAPRELAERMIAVRYPPNVTWMMLGLAAVITVLITILTQALFPPTPEQQQVVISVTPLVGAIVTFFLMGVISYALFAAGKALGGTGEFPETMMIVSGFQFVAAAISLIQLGLSLAVPSLIGVLALASAGLTLYVVFNFLDVLHGFGSVWKAGGLFLLAVTGVILGLFVILTLIGAVSMGGQV